MTYERKNKGVCSRSTKVTLEGDIITDLEIADGCDGNLSGICALARGQKAADVIQRLKGTRCGSKSTSCPDQIALCLEEALASGQ